MLIISPTSGLTARTRLYKIAQLMTSSNIDFQHWGWLRAQSDMLDESPELKLTKKIYLLKGGGYNNFRNKVMYFFWIVIVFFRLLLVKKTSVWALGLETAFPAVLASYFRGHKIIFDDADRLVLLFGFSGFWYKLIRRIEIFTSSKSLFHIVPSVKRYDYTSRNFLELKNLPTKKNVLKAMALKVPDNIELFCKGKIVIYANGWLSDTRGAQFIIDLIEKIKSNSLENKVSIICAGRIDSQPLKEKLNNDFSLILDEMVYEAALSIYKLSDYVITLYDPRIKINKYAESNKWGDALSFSVTPVVNSDVITADFIIPVSVIVDYENSEQLISNINARLMGVENTDKALMNDILSELTPFECGVSNVLAECK